MGNKSFRAACETAKEQSASRAGKIAVSGRYHEPPRRFQDDYELQDLVLGTGVGGKVLLATERQSGNRVAVKHLNVRGVSERAKQNLRNEVEIFLALDHPRITRLLDVYEADGGLILVMECMEGGELFDRVVEREQFSEKDAAETAESMLLPLNYLHGQGITHCDVKLENYLYQKRDNNLLKLADFGFSKVRQPDTRLKSCCGTLAYVAPEVLGCNYDSQCDLWSLGVCVFILLVGYMPFDGSDSHVTVLIKSGMWDMNDPKWERVSGLAKDFVRKLLVVDPASRLTAEQALKHQWVVGREQLKQGDPAFDAGILTAMRKFAGASKFRRACMEMMAWSLSFEERTAVRDAFEELDVAKQGTITLRAFREVLKARFDVHDEDTKKVFDALDATHDQVIHYSEFLAAMVSSRIALHDGLLRATFRRFDTSGSGYLTRESLEQVLGKTFDGEEVKGLLEEADYNGDGKITPEEFMEYLRGGDVLEAHAAAADRVIDTMLKDPQARAGVTGNAEPEVAKCPVRRRFSAELEFAERRVRRKTSSNLFDSQVELQS